MFKIGWTNNKKHPRIKGAFPIFILLSSIALFSLSCSQEKLIGEYVEEGCITPVRLALMAPSDSRPVKNDNHRQLQTDNEMAISEITVMVFNTASNLFMYKAEGTIQSSTNNITTFDVNLRSSQHPVSLYVVANVNSVIEEAGLQAGLSEASVKTRLNRLFTSSGIGGEFPMFGRYNLPSLAADQVNVITSVKMLRSIARVDIDARQVGPGADDPEKRLFRLVDVRAYRSNGSIQVIPVETISGNEQSPQVTLPSIPSPVSKVSVTDPVAVPAGNFSTSQLYLPEAETSGDLQRGITCLVVGGYYKGSGQMSYYRVDFLADDPLYKGRILRNHRYLFNIKNVTSAGWETPQEAADNLSTGIVATIEDWDDETTELWFDGPHHFGVSSREITTSYRATASQSIKVTTDLTSGYTIRWTDSEGNDLASAANGETLLTAGYSLENNWFRITQHTDSYGNMTLLAENKLDNNGYSPRSSHFVIEVHRWRILMTVTQKIRQTNDNKYVRIISGLEIGSLGPGTGNTTGTLSTALKTAINTNFKIGGAVGLHGIDYVQTSGPGTVALNSSLSAAALSGYDIVFMTYANIPDAATAQRIIDWLRADKHRVLVMGFDYSWTNIELLKNPYISYDLTNVNYPELVGHDCPLVKVPGGEYFWREGPFTDSEIADGTAYRQSDIYWGRATPSANSTIIPLLNSANGQMMMGVDKVKRIVYVGDVQWGHQETGAGFVGKRFNRADGNVAADSGIAKLISNVWAWMIEEVVFGED